MGTPVAYAPRRVVVLSPQGLPVVLLNVIYSRTVQRLHARLHDELEQEGNVINRGTPDAVSGHYHRFAFALAPLEDGV